MYMVKIKISDPKKKRREETHGEKAMWWQTQRLMMRLRAKDCSNTRSWKRQGKLLPCGLWIAVTLGHLQCGLPASRNASDVQDDPPAWCSAATVSAAPGWPPHLQGQWRIRLQPFSSQTATVFVTFSTVINKLHEKGKKNLKNKVLPCLSMAS